MDAVIDAFTIITTDTPTNTSTIATPTAAAAAIASEKRSDTETATDISDESARVTEEVVSGGWGHCRTKNGSDRVKLAGTRWVRKATQKGREGVVKVSLVHSLPRWRNCVPLLSGH